MGKIKKNFFEEKINTVSLAVLLLIPDLYRCTRNVSGHLLGTGMYVGAVIHSLSETVGDHKVLLSLEASAWGSMYSCMADSERVGEAEVSFGTRDRGHLYKLLNSSAANIRKVCLSRAMEIYIIIFFYYEVLE